MPNIITRCCSVLCRLKSLAVSICTCSSSFSMKLRAVIWMVFWSKAATATAGRWAFGLVGCECLQWYLSFPKSPLLCFRWLTLSHCEIAVHNQRIPRIYTGALYKKIASYRDNFWSPLLCRRFLNEAWFTAHVGDDFYGFVCIACVVA